MNCRGHERRIKIVKNWEVTPLAHIKLLDGSEIRSDAGNDITDSYYLFQCANKMTGVSDSIRCGRAVAEDFCNLTGSMMPKYFNPLRVEGDGKSQTIGYSSSTIQEEAGWHPMRVQLYHAIMLIIVAWNAKPGTPLYSVLKRVVNGNFLARPPREGDIKAVNTILKHGKTTISQVIQQIEVLANNKKMKNYQFDMLNEKLDFLGIDSRFV